MRNRWNLSATLALSFTAAVLSVHCGGSTVGGTDASNDTGASSGSSGGSGSSSSGGGTCSPVCGAGRMCCSGSCVYTLNDPHNCGACGHQCDGATPFCNGSGTCVAVPCTLDGAACGNGGTCCGTACCDSTQICCEPNGPLDRGPACQTPSGNPPSCAAGCAPLCVSDRNLKRDFEPIDEQAVLESVARLPISTWSYNADDPSVRHMGPMAQDFKAAFALGNTDKAYNSIDAHGVALAAIHALYERVREQETRLERLERENARLRDTCASGR